MTTFNGNSASLIYQILVKRTTEPQSHCKQKQNCPLINLYSSKVVVECKDKQPGKEHLEMKRIERVNLLVRLEPPMSFTLRKRPACQLFYRQLF